MTAPERAGERVAAMQSVCDEISRIMETYREQEANGGVDTPGGLEHMGDVWRLLSDWDDQLRAAALRTPAPADVTDGDVRDVADAIVSWVIGPTEPGADELLAYISSVILAHSQAAVARERAECAKVAWDFAARRNFGQTTAEHIAAAIEARGQKE